MKEIFLHLRASGIPSTHFAVWENPNLGELDKEFPKGKKIEKIIFTIVNNYVMIAFIILRDFNVYLRYYNRAYEKTPGKQSEYPVEIKKAIKIFELLKDPTERWDIKKFENKGLISLHFDSTTAKEDNLFHEEVMSKVFGKDNFRKYIKDLVS